MTGLQLNEKEVFTRHYASLCNTLTDVSNLLPHFVQRNIISTSDVEDINTITTTAKKVEKLLSHISGPLTAGDPKGFHMMLTIMKEHGNQCTKDLAMKIMTSSNNSKMEHEVINDNRHQEPSYTSHLHTSGPTKPVASSEQPTVKTADPLSVQFSTFVATIEALLETCHDKLEQSKRSCLNFTISDNSDELLFSDEQMQKINACTTFSELFTILRKHWSWKEYSILTSIISIVGLKEAKDEVEIFQKRMASYQGMKLISEDIPREAISHEYIRLSIIIDKPYREFSLENFTELQKFIFSNLDVKAYIARPFIKFLFDSLHLEWYVLKKAASHMIKMAKQNEETFTSNAVVFIQIDQLVVLDCKAKKVDDEMQTNDAKSSSDYRSGGYGYDFVHAPPDRLLCKICQLPCREAQQSECCGNIYCKCDIDQLKATTTAQPPCPMCRSKDFITHPNLAIDREVQQLMVYCPAKETAGCDWIGKLDDVDKHYSDGKECETECEKCKTIVKHKLLCSHLDTECPCYCPYCDMTAKREVISSEHKENYHKFPLTCPNNNIGVDNVPHDKFDKTINIIESQNEIFNKIYKMFNPSSLDELQKDISTIRKEFAQVTKKHLNDQNNPTVVNQLYNIRSYITIAVLIVAILIALFLQLNSLQKRVEESNYRYNKSFTSLQQQITLLQEVLNKTAVASQQHYDQLSSSVWSIKLWLSSEMSNKIAPVVVKMSSFSKKLRDKEQWYSSPFFTFEGGYQLCLRVDAAGNGKGEGTHVSVFLHLMKGPHDNELEQLGHWPLRGTFTIELLNQLNDNDHYSHMVQFHHHICSECVNRVLEGDKANAAWGLQFISHDTLLHHSNNSYHKSDYLMFRISYEDMEAPYQVAPVSFKVTKFSYWLKSNNTWLSSPFFAFEEGYQLYLIVHANGYAEGEGTHVSVFLRLMKSPHDDELEQSGHWPLRGIFTIELLNQLNDSDHYSRMLQFHHHFCSECANRVLEGDKTKHATWHLQFISHDTLLHHSNNSYHKSDYLMFRISYEDMEAPYQVAPVSFKVTKFSHWLKSKDSWSSSPFFAFEEGYQLHLIVNADGYDEDEGTHVSVFLHLLKGPHDDELEQSGHWPLRGTFTIELLNQLNDSDHYSRMIQFHHHICSKCTNRILEKGNDNAGWGDSQFISHDTLLRYSNNSYHKGDYLMFRISYEDMEAPYQVAPVSFKVTKFSYWLKNNDTWRSSLFFAFEGGYQLYLIVHADGYAEGEGTHVSVYLHLMKGPHDDELEQSGHWPLRGTFTIELLNQLNDSDYSSTAMYDASRNVTKVNDDDSVMINVMPQFISHYALFQHNGYLINDVLNFRISYLANSDDDSKGN